MKYLFTILVISLGFTFLFSQEKENSIKPKWSLVGTDTTARKEKQFYNTSMASNFIEDDNKNLYVTWQSIYGWKISKIASPTGKVLWENFRNQNLPDKDGRSYLPKDIFFTEDGNIEVIGTRNGTYPAAPLFGTSVKSIYDKITGKELSFVNLAFIGGGATSSGKGATIRQYIKLDNKKGYYFADGRPSAKIISIRRLDTNLVAKDTVFITRMTKDTAKSFLPFSSSMLHKINNKLYYITGLLAGGTDTSERRVYFIKYNTGNKNTVVTDITKHLFHAIGNVYNTTDDGIVAVATTDSLYDFSANGKGRILVTKIDTNGNTVWRNWIINPSLGDSPFLGVVKDNKSNGFWVTVGDRENKYKPHLYYIKPNTPPQLICTISRPIKDTTTFAVIQPVMLKNGDMILTYAYKESKEERGILCLDRSTIDKFLTSDKEVVLEQEIQVFPNPTNNYVNVVLPKSQSFSYFLTDISGNVVLRKQIETTNSTEIKMGQLSKGIYFINIKTIDNQIFTKKIVKQ